RRDPQRFQTDLHVLAHGEPGQQGKALEHHGGPRICPVQRDAPVGDLSGCGGAISPAMQRSSVLFPEPERPSSATISPSRRSTEMSSSTGSGLPSGEVNDFDTRVTSMMVAGPAPGPLAGRAAVPVIGYRPGRGAPRRSPSARSQRESRFGQPVQPPPEQPVDDDDERAHEE